MKLTIKKSFGFLLLICAAVLSAEAQSYRRELDLKKNGAVEIVNLFGRVEAAADERTPPAETDAAPDVTTNGASKITSKIIVTADAASDAEIKIDQTGGTIKIEIAPSNAKKRIDLSLKLPARSKLKITTSDGEIRFDGDYETVTAATETGTIAAAVPLENVRYDFVWTQSRPRFLSDIELGKVEEKRAGRFAVNGKISERDAAGGGEKTAKEKRASDLIRLNLTTARGIILFNVPPNEVSSDLRERPLTDAAKAIIRSGDSLLTGAIRRASPKYFGDYAATLPPLKREPVLTDRSAASAPNDVRSTLKKVLVRVTDINNRAVGDLGKADFELSEAGENKEIVSVVPATAPFNLVLLLDVSGSVDNYVNFIRKAARSFVNTVGKNDKIAVIIFSEDVEVIANFTTDKPKVSAALDTFDAGGATAYYDALGYVLAETLRPLRGERTAIVALTDGDDNRSFLPFDALLGSIQESGALVYPLYVPSALIASAAGDPNTTVDPVRARYNGLTTKAEGEGEKLARISGGVYYPISQLDQIQKAYDDIAVQLRTSYSVTFRSALPESFDKTTASPRLKVRVKRENTFVKLGSVVAVGENGGKVSAVSDEDFFRKIAFRDGIAAFAPPAASRRRQSAEISGDVKTISYRQFVNDRLRELKWDNFDVNKSPGAFLLNIGGETIAVSRWITPKRTRSYPYQRVYDTLPAAQRKITIIPVVKDEGLGGARDFLQWDTLPLLSLLDVRVILAYYDAAEKSTRGGDRITNQKLDDGYIAAHLKEAAEFKGTAREWNERETAQLKLLFEKAALAYQKISRETKTYLHDQGAFDEVIAAAATPQKFIEFSRGKSKKAQSREFVTDQPKEALSTDTKAKVTINNALFGKYFFTCDETRIEDKTLYLIEAKHSARGKMPSKNDIKDGFIKLMIYTNLNNVKVGGKPHRLKVQIRLTADRLKGSINSDADADAVGRFLAENAFAVKDAEFVKKIFEEARANNFTIILEHAESLKSREKPPETDGSVMSFSSALAARIF